LRIPKTGGSETKLSRPVTNYDPSDVTWNRRRLGQSTDSLQTYKPYRQFCQPPQHYFPQTSLLAFFLSYHPSPFYFFLFFLSSLLCFLLSASIYLSFCPSFLLSIFFLIPFLLTLFLVFHLSLFPPPSLCCLYEYVHFSRPAQHDKTHHCQVICDAGQIAVFRRVLPAFVAAQKGCLSPDVSLLL